MDPARSRATGGTGLGLAIVKHVAANHGGEVKLWSRPGTGSTFTLRIPRHGAGQEEAEPGAAGEQEQPADEDEQGHDRHATADRDRGADRAVTDSGSTTVETGGVR